MTWYVFVFVIYEEFHMSWDKFGLSWELENRKSRWKLKKASMSSVLDNPYLRGTTDHSRTSYLLCMCRQCSQWEGVKSQEHLCAYNSPISVKSNWQFGWQNKLVLPWALLSPCSSDVLDVSSWLWRTSIWEKNYPRFPRRENQSSTETLLTWLRSKLKAPGCLI